MKYKRKVDTKMRDYGETDFEKKQIRVNPKKRDLLNTIIHEELHRQYPEKPEKWIQKKTEKKEKDLTIPRAIELLQRYKRGKK